MLAIVFNFLIPLLPRPGALLISFLSFDSSEVKVPVPRFNSLSSGISILSLVNS